MSTKIRNLMRGSMQFDVAFGDNDISVQVDELGIRMNIFGILCNICCRNTARQRAGFEHNLLIEPI